MKRRAFILLDALVAMLILAALLAALASVVHGHGRAAGAMADRLAAMSLAEQVLVSLQARQLPPRRINGGNYSVEALPGKPPVAGLVWVRVTAEHRGQAAELIGVAPPSGGPTP